MSDEIIVRGFRLDPAGRPLSGQIAPPPVNREPPVGPAALGFLAPAAPAAVEEIVVKGKAQAARVAPATRVPRTTPATIFATVGGVLIAKILDELGQQKVEEAFREFESIKGRAKPDTPLQVQPEPAPVVTIPEIIVTARRRSSLFNLAFGGLPPGILPNAPPRTPPRRRGRPTRDPRPPGRPRRPRRRPGTPQKPKPPSIRPPSIPSQPPAEVPIRDPARIVSSPPARIPSTQPARIRDPGAGSQIRFATAPGAFPGFLPAAGAGLSLGRSAAQLRFQSSGLTGVGSVIVPSAQPQAQPAAQQARCRPCPRKKEKDKKRKKCYVQLVHQRRFKRWDRVTKWREIDCDTGRPV